MLVDSRYLVVRTLSANKDVAVYLVRDILDSSLLVLKQLQAKSDADNTRQSLKHEFAVLRALAHPNIVAVYDFGICKLSGPYFTMEFVGPHSLASLPTRLSPHQLQVTLLQLVDALGYLNSRHLIHGDISPSNIVVDLGFVESDGAIGGAHTQGSQAGTSLRATLIDFEMATQHLNSDTHPLQGTPSYISPELLLGTSLAHTSDIFSLGRSIAHAASTTHSGLTTNGISNTRIEPSDSDPVHNSTLTVIINKMSAFEPRDRFSSAEELLGVLSSDSPDLEYSERSLRTRSYFTRVPLQGHADLLKSVEQSLFESRPTNRLDIQTSPRVYLIGGEHGIGKSRLTQEIRHRAQAAGLRTVSVTCNPHGLDDLRQLYLLLGPSEASRAGEAPTTPATLGRREQSLSFPQYFPYAGVHGSINVPDTHVAAVRHTGHDNHRIQALHGLASSIRALSAVDPLAVVVDNIHYADQETLELVRLLAVHAQGPILVATYQTESSTKKELESFLRYLVSHQNTKHLVLDRLSVQDTVGFISSALGEPSAENELARVLHRLTGGIPLLLQETLVSLVKERHISRLPSGWRVNMEEIEASQLPSNLQTFAKTKLNELPHRLTRILEVMAVLDAPITPARIVTLTGRDPNSLASDLRLLLDSGVLVHHVSAHGDLFTLRHACVREVIYYEELDPARRRSLHCEIAQLLEQSPSSTADSVIDQIAFHYIEGVDQVKGPEYAFRAAHLAMERFATQHAIDLLARALNLTPKDSVEQRFHGLETLGALLWLAGDLARAKTCYEEMLLLSRTTGPPSKEALAIREIAWVLIECGEIVKGLNYAEDAERRFTKLGDPVSAVRAILIQAQALRKMGEFDSASIVAARGYEASLESGDIYGQSLARIIDGLVANDRGDHVRAIVLMEHALALKTQIEDLPGMVITLNNIGLVHLDQERPDKAEPYFTRCLAEARAKGLSLAATLASNNLGEVYRLKGDLAVGEEMLHEAIALAEGSGRQHFAAYAEYNLGYLRYLRGDFTAAVSALSKAESVFEHTDARSDLCLVLICKGQVFQTLGLLKLAHEVMRKAIPTALAIRNPQTMAGAIAVESSINIDYGPTSASEVTGQVSIDDTRVNGRVATLNRLLWTRALLSLSEDRPADALEDIQEMKTIAKEAGLRPDVARAALLEGQALMKLQRSHEARLVLQQGTEAAREMGLRPLLSHLLYWLSQAQEAGGQAQAAADSVFEAADVIKAIAGDIKDDAWRQSYLNVPTNLAALQHAERVERAGMQRRPSADEAAADPEAAAARAFEEVRRQLGAEAPLRTLLTAVLDRAVEAIRADRGLLILLNPAKAEAGANAQAEAEVTIARNLEGETIRDAADYCRSILHEVAAGDPILAIDVPADARFRARQSVTLYNILSLMCVPLKLGDRVLGAIYFDSRSGDRLFRKNDLRLIEEFSVKVSGAIAEAQETQRLRERAVVINRELARKYHMDNLIGESSAMQRLFRMMQAVIRADCNVLVMGESGTGKELVARAIHYAGARKLSNFVPLDCGAVPENLIESELFGHRRGAFTGADSDKKGLFEEADGGSLFLDEITNTSPAFQAKLLRVLQSGEFRRVGETLTRRADVRIIAATNADIDQVIKNGTFREDLYYRLNVVTLTLPTLRERLDDIPLLAEHFAHQFCQSREVPYRGIGRGAMARLQAHSWPGNVRELEHAIEAALVVSGDGMVRREALPEKILGGELEVVRDLLCETAAAAAHPDGQKTLAGHESADDQDSDVHTRTPVEPEERARVEEALIKSGGDKSRAARLLGWNRMRLYRRLKILGIPYDTGKEAD